MMARGTLQVVLLLGLLSLISGHVSFFGKCPWIPPVEHFDITKFVGDWYSVQKTPPVAPCVTYHVAGTDEEEKYIITEYSELGHNKFMYKFSGLLSVVFPDDPGKLYLRYPQTLKGYRYHVFATDYVNYAGVFVCQSFGLFHRRSIILLSRERTLTDHYVQAMMYKLEQYEIPLDGLTVLDQASCLKDSLHHETSHQPAAAQPPVQPLQPAAAQPPVQPLQPAAEPPPPGPQSPPAQPSIPVFQPDVPSGPIAPIGEPVGTAEPAQPDTTLNVVTDFPLTGVEESVPVFNLNLTGLLNENSDDSVFAQPSDTTEVDTRAGQ